MAVCVYLIKYPPFELIEPNYKIHPSIHPSTAFLKPGRGGSSLSKELQTSLSWDTSSGGTPRHCQARRDIVPPAYPGSSRSSTYL